MDLQVILELQVPLATRQLVVKEEILALQGLQVLLGLLDQLVHLESQVPMAHKVHEDYQEFQVKREHPETVVLMGFLDYQDYQDFPVTLVLQEIKA